MSDLDMLRTTASRIMARSDKRPSSDVGIDDAMWLSLSETGLAQLAVPEAVGGSGGSLEQALVVLLEAGRAAAPVPLAETSLLAGWACGRAGLPLPEGALTVVSSGDLVVASAEAGWQIDGTATRAPWASVAGRLIVVAPSGAGSVVLSVPADAVTIERGGNLAGEPRDTVRFAGVAVPAADAATTSDDLSEQLLLRGGLSRAVLTAGALQTVLEMTRTYVIERVQFGRPLAAFQVVKQQVAELAGEVAAASVAAEAAALTSESGDLDPLAVAAAKIAAARAASVAEVIAHQLHGAIGFTEEHPLHLFTQRLTSWRDEYGTQSWWESRLGQLVSTSGADQLWPRITARYGQESGDTST